MTTELEELMRGAAEVISAEALADKLNTGKKLRIKLGVDPTAPDIHLGHTVVLRKLRQFQDLGHEVIFLIGDFTARIGDPTGKSSTRVAMKEEDIKHNAETYLQQVYKLLDPGKTTIAFNSEWLNTLGFTEVVALTSKYTVSRMLEREDFAKRYKEERAIHIHEFIYPLAQGYDSVALKADVELGGMDQKFNLLMGRHLQKEYGQEPQVAILMPLLVGLDGVNKMSKSLQNYVGIDEAPDQMYGKLMSIPDHLIYPYFELLTPLPLSELAEIQTQLHQRSINPRDLKMRLALTITTSFYGSEAGAVAQEAFRSLFQEKELPSDIPEIIFRKTNELQLVANILLQAGLVKTQSEGRRAIVDGGVTVGDQRLTDPTAKIELEDGLLLRVGKRRFAKIKLT